MTDTNNTHKIQIAGDGTPEQFSKPILDLKESSPSSMLTETDVAKDVDPFLQDLVSLGRTKYIEGGGHFNISIPVMILTKGLMVTGSIIPVEVWVLSHYRLLDKNMAAAISRATGTSIETLASIDNLEERCKEFGKQASKHPPNYIHLKDARVVNDASGFNLGSAFLRIRLAAIDGWCLAVEPAHD